MFKESSAERYVKNVSQNPEMSHNKLLARIRQDSTVLEFGPASGAMTKVLSGQMGCHVTIVELDRKCFEYTMRFAEDGVCTDIESYEWEKKLQQRKYDYVVFADVLEHLLHPQDVLEHVKKYLREDGAVLISVPNIAHNSVIIELLKNRFIYQSTGILDYTHVHHFTFSELQMMCKAAGYNATYLDAVYIGVGRNEFSDRYGDIDPVVADYLKKRPFGEVYQHIVEIRDSKYVREHHLKTENCLGHPADYTDRATIDPSEDTSTVNGTMERLYMEPNTFFENNHEIARLRLEINDLYLSLGGQEAALENIRRLNELRDELSEKDYYIRTLQGEDEKKDARIEELQDAEQQRNEHIVTLDREIKASLDEREALERQSKDLGQEKERLERECGILTEKYNNLMGENKSLSEEHKTLQEQHAVLAEQYRAGQEEREIFCNEKKELLQQLRNKEGHIELLLESEREFERYKQTRAYRATIRRRKIVDKLLPPDSKRLFILRVIKKMICHPVFMLHVVRPGNIGNYIKYLHSDSIEEITARYDEIEAVAKGETGSLDAVPGVEHPDEQQDDNLRIEDFEPLWFPEQEHPAVSIVIPVYNQFRYTYACLQSILKNSGDVSYEILIANDCSTDITGQIAHVAKNVRLITTEHNMRFLRNCNNAAQYARGEYILFLNNDTQVMENWLQPLIDLMENHADIGMVGSKLIYPDGKLQEAGGIVWKDASAWNYGHLKNPDDPEFNYVKEVDYISGAAIMIRSSLWREIGGFDERFAPAYYEDTDLAFEVRKHGYKVVYQPQSVVVHFEGISNGTDVTSGQKMYQQVNRDRFYEKWQSVLEREHFENGRDVYLAKDRGQLRKQILVVDHYVPNYDKDAGGRCTYMYLKMFLKLGMKVTFIGDNFARPEPYTTELNGMGIEILYGNYYYNNWEAWLKDNLHYFDYIYLQRPHISIKYIDLVKTYGRGKIFYFAHDLHHVRMYRDYLLNGDPKILRESERWKKIELELFEKADVGHVVGTYEQGVMQKVFPDKPIRNIPLYIYDSVPTDIEKDFSKRNDLLFVGGFGHDPNIDAVIWFYENIYPKILDKYPNMIWHIVGSKAPEEVTSLAGKNVVLEGFVSDEDLASLYKKCRLAVVPLRYGAGVKGKVVEAAYYQIPLVTTSIGGEGLDASAGAFVMEDDAGKMADLICSLYEDSSMLKKMSDSGAGFISKYFTPQVAQQVLQQDL